MPWTPANADYLTVFAAVLAAGLTLLGLLSGLAQFTRSARARRTIEWTTAALATETHDERKAVLERLRVRAHAQLISAHYVPLWRFGEAAVWSVLAPVFLAVGAVGDASVGSVLSMSVTGLLALTILARRAVRLYAERQRVIFAYRQGREVEPVRTDILELMEGGTRREFLLAMYCSLALMGLGGLTAWALRNPDDRSLWAYVGLGMFAAWGAFASVHTYAVRLAPNPPRRAAEA